MVNIVDNPGLGEAKEHITCLTKISMKISSPCIYLLETGSVGGEEAAKFFRKLMRENHFRVANIYTLASNQTELFTTVQCSCRRIDR